MMLMCLNLFECLHHLMFSSLVLFSMCWMVAEMLVGSCLWRNFGRRWCLLDLNSAASLARASAASLPSEPMCPVTHVMDIEGLGAVFWCDSVSLVLYYGCNWCQTWSHRWGTVLTSCNHFWTPKGGAVPFVCNIPPRGLLHISQQLALVWASGPDPPGPHTACTHSTTPLHTLHYTIMHKHLGHPVNYQKVHEPLW